MECIMYSRKGAAIRLALTQVYDTALGYTAKRSIPQCALCKTSRAPKISIL